MNKFIFIIITDEQKERFDIYLSYNTSDDNSSSILYEEEASNKKFLRINEQITNILLRQLLERYYLKYMADLFPFIHLIFWPDW